MNGREKRRLQRCLEDLYCNQCDICICGCSSNAAVDICDCCVKPMQDFLIRLQSILTPTGTIQLYLTNGNANTVTFQQQNITTIQDGIITGTDSNGKINSVSICQISRVETNNNPALTAGQINLLPAPSCTCGECDCCEKAVREKLATYATGDLIVLGYEPDGKTSIERFEKVGLGIALTVNNGQLIGYSTCKITNIQQA